MNAAATNVHKNNINNNIKNIHHPLLPLSKFELKMPAEGNNDIVKIYVDGSYNVDQKIGAYAFVVINQCNNVVYSECRSIVKAGLLAGRQVGCECKAVVEAVRWCVNNNAVCDIYYDLINLQKWIDDIWGKKPWKTNTPYSQAYRYYCLNNRRHIRSMVKVKSHSGVFYNEMVDTMCQSCYV